MEAQYGTGSFQITGQWSGVYSLGQRIQLPRHCRNLWTVLIILLRKSINSCVLCTITEGSHVYGHRGENRMVALERIRVSR